VKAHPKALFVIVGATHPDVLRRDGEAYRSALANRVAALRLTEHVRFVDKFVGRVELTRLLESADVFVSPSPNPGKMLSGPLSYAMGAGRAIVTTPYPYATELLAGGRGVVAAAATREALATEIIALLGDPDRRLAMGARVHEASRPMTWTRVGTAYHELFQRVAADRPSREAEAPFAIGVR
jgi:glycosyltransferase involved in cell wall biosynthesis